MKGQAVGWWCRVRLGDAGRSVCISPLSALPVFRSCFCSASTVGVSPNYSSRGIGTKSLAFVVGEFRWFGAGLLVGRDTQPVTVCREGCGELLDRER